MDETVSAVQDMYTKYPFPGHYQARVESIGRYPGFMRGFLLGRLKKKIAKSKRYARLIKKLFPEGVAGKRILDAGCGTGEIITSASCHLPEATFLGLDLSPESIRCATELKEGLKIPNLEFRQADLLDLPELEPFDLILSIGCLHHLPDPAAGLVSLRKQLKEGGQMVVFLYSSLGRFEVICKRKGLSILIPNQDRYQDKLAAIEDLGLFPAPPQGSWMKRFKKWIRSDVDYNEVDSVKIDQLAHVQEHNYTVEEIFALLDETGLEFVRFVAGMPDSLEEVTSSPRVLEMAKGLDRMETYRMIELMFRPMDYTFLCRPRAEA